MTTSSSRRVFLQQSATLGAATLGAASLGAAVMAGHFLGRTLNAAETPANKIKLGLCTYLWGKDWDLPTVIANCEKAKVFGVELRVEHKHGVGLSLNAQQRQEVKKRFADSQVTFVGMGTNQCFDSTDSEQLKRSIETTKAFCHLSQECGGSGVKVKPNDFQKGVSHEQTIEQIGKSLNIVGKYAADLGQQIRLEVHGSCCELPVIHDIMKVADHPNVAVCWNSNGNDLKGDGLEANFDLVKDRLGATCHVRELNLGDYPYQQFFDLLVKAHYAGWVLLECRTSPSDLVVALAEQQSLFAKMLPQ
jgi:sugar phosphate isomerase/epimerase